MEAEELEDEVDEEEEEEEEEGTETLGDEELKNTSATVYTEKLKSLP